ncbi:hypothetical protein L1887_33947 [Cichorium endivia]|nr:hypothetical protein L1887_33947 [Cichorium endivia]
MSSSPFTTTIPLPVFYDVVDEQWLGIRLYPEVRGAISIIEYHGEFLRFLANFEVPAQYNLDMLDLLEFGKLPDSWCTNYRLSIEPFGDWKFNLLTIAEVELDSLLNWIC